MAISEIENARNVFVRIVLSELMVAVCMAADDPAAEAKRRARVKLDSADWLAETAPGNDAFKHALLHDFETFWRGVRKEVEERVARDLSA